MGLMEAVVNCERLILKVLLYLVVREFDDTRYKYPGELANELRAAIAYPKLMEPGTSDSWTATPPLGRGKQNL